MNNDKFYLSPEDIKPLVDMPGGCIATNRITVEGKPVGFMYRQKPNNEHDTGWRFFSGVNEDDQYMSNLSNSHVFSVNTVANYDQSIIPYLDSPIGSVFERGGDARDWQVVTDFVVLA